MVNGQILVNLKKIEQLKWQVVRYTLALLNEMEQLYSLICTNGFGALPLEVLEMKLLQPLSEKQITMLKCTIAGGRTKGANERSFVFVHQYGGDDVT